MKKKIKSHPLLDKMMKLESEIRELDKKVDFSKLKPIEELVLKGIQERGYSYSDMFIKEFSRRFSDGKMDITNLIPDIKNYTELLEKEKLIYLAMGGSN